MEALTDALEEEANSLLEEIDARGGAVQATEWMQARIEESAYRTARGIEDGSITVVGVNRYRDDDSPDPHDQSHRSRPGEVPAGEAGPPPGESPIRKRWKDRYRRWEEQPRGEENLMYPMREALGLGATLGEVSGVLREAFGVHRPGT